MNSKALSDIQLCRKKGLAAAKEIIEKFSLRKTCQNYLYLYNEVLRYDAWMDEKLSSQEFDKKIRASDFYT